MEDIKEDLIDIKAMLTEVRTELKVLGKRLDLQEDQLNRQDERLRVVESKANTAQGSLDVLIPAYGSLVAAERRRFTRLQERVSEPLGD